jgi:Ni/Fe-hydrogenase subunit HybB-like protein
MLLRFIRDCAREVLRGGPAYRLWLGGCALVALAGFCAYANQLDGGLAVTGMSDQVSWGVYIANFTFLVGMAAAAVMVVLPAYVFHNKDAKQVVMLAEGVAVAACTMALLFVIVDLGRPDRFWHMIPFIGRFNWPRSMLSWDVIVLSGYLGLNLAIPLYVLFSKWAGRAIRNDLLFGAVIVSIIWAISIHTVTAFLFSSSTSRPFWHTALLAPRFLASAFAAGPAGIILAFKVIEAKTDFEPSPAAIRLLSLIATAALQINLFMVFAEVFTEFYSPTHHTTSAHYLFLGLGEHRALVPWIYSALFIEVIAVVILTVAPLRERGNLLAIACVLTTVGIWTEKGMGLIVPGFVPTPLGEVLEYTPTLTEVLVSIGIWAVGLLVFTILAKAAIPIELGRVHAAEATLGSSTSVREVAT